MYSKYCTIMKELRKEKKLSQEEIAKKINVSQRTYSNYENGQREPSIETLIKLAEFYNITLDTLAGIETKKLEPLTEKERYIIHKFRELKKTYQDKIEERIETFLEQQTEEEAKNKESA